MKIRNILSFCLIVLALSACDKLFHPDMTGQAIQFGISSDSGLRTRTEYRGKQEDGRELIYWTGDDDVTIHMYWDGEGGDVGDSADYDVINAYVETDKSICKGKLSPKTESLRWKGDFTGDDGRIHEYEHSFYSVYPAGSATFYNDEKQFVFNLDNESSGVDMRKAYMAAGLEKVTSEDSPVLQYYPMITTLHVTLVNDTDNPITPGDIVLSSTDKPICGRYIVQFNGSKFAFQSALDNDGKTITINVPDQLDSKGETDIAFFIIPQEYDPATLSFKINGKEHIFGDTYKSTLLEAYKYNITVSLSGKDLTFKDAIGPGEAQFLILWITNYLKDGNFNDFFGFDQNGDHRFGAFNDKFINGGIDWNSEDIADEFVDFFTEDQLNKLYQLLLSVTSFKTTNKQITSPLHADFFSLFPNLEEIYIQTYSTVEVGNLDKLKTATFQYATEVNVFGCKSLTEVTLENSTNLVSLVIDDCESLTDIKADNGNKLEEIKLINTPKFKYGEVKNVGSTIAVTLINCSTDVDNATLDLGGKYTIKERTNSSNVTVQ